MSSHVALLRAVNVGGHNRVAMSDLRELFAHLGFESVQTLLQSGNVVFSSPSGSLKTLERKLQTSCADRLGVETEVFIRSAQQWNGVVQKNPFPEEARKTPGQLVVVFLGKPASASALRSLEGMAGKEYVSGARTHLYVVYPDGIGRSRLTASVIEKTLGRPSTARNWNTILRIHGVLSQATSATSSGELADRPEAVSRKEGAS